MQSIRLPDISYYGVKYGIDPEFGFLPRYPAKSFNCPMLRHLDEFVRVAQTADTQEILPAIENMPLVFIPEHPKVSRSEERRAMMILLFMQSFWVHLAKSSNVPAQIAHPLYELYLRRGEKYAERPHMVSYQSGVLDNWYLKNSRRALVLENIEPFMCFTGTEDEKRFVALHVLYEHAGGTIPILAFTIRHMQTTQKAETILRETTWALQSIERSIQEMQICVEMLPDLCDPDVYFEQIRPWFASLGKISYGKLNGYFERTNVPAGSSAAQSPLLPFLDAFLGISGGALDAREEILPTHAKAIQDIASTSLKKFAKGAWSNEELSEAYHACVQTLASFRQKHEEAIQPYLKGAHDGTGGSPTDTWLRERRRETKKALVG